MTDNAHQPDEADRQSLIEIAKRLADKLPDMRQKARDTANEILHKHTGHYGEPDKIWWHRWDSANSTPRSFTGWEHWGKPIESMTFPQLVMARFHASDQDNADLLHQMGGFYTQGPNERVYNEQNEVRLDPQDVLNDFWSLNFAADFVDELRNFWAHHAEDFRVMAKANFLSKALEDREARRLSDAQFKTLVKAVAGDVTWPVTLQTLHKKISPSAQLKVYAFDIGGYIAADILRIVDQDGWQYLYMPGEINAFHAFATDQDLYWWVLSQTNMAENRARFMSHWPADDRTGDNNLNHSIDLLFYGWGKNPTKALNTLKIALSEDPFTFLADNAEQRMFGDLALVGRSNGDLRKQMWVGYLKAFGTTFGGLAAVDWPVALAVVGASVAELGLHIDEAVNGHTTANRKDAVIASITSAIDVLFNAAFLWTGGEEGVGSEFRGPERAIPLAELEPHLTGPLAATQTAELLAPLETNELLTGQSVGEVGKMRGVYLNEAGQTHIEMDGIGYQVRWVNDLNGWAIVDPANPHSFYRNVPVRLDAQGQWQALERPGLKGGGKIFGKKPWGNPVTGPSQPLTPTFRYDVPTSLRETLSKAAAGFEDKALSGERGVMLQPGQTDPYAEFRALREQLRSASVEFINDVTLPPRPAIPELDPLASQPHIIKSIYAKTDGMVIGETHSSVASKKFLIDNMELLAKQKVRTLFLEHLLTDFHQVHLDTFARTGSMPQVLETYLVDMDRGFHTDPQGRYTFLELVKAANRNHIRVQALDCMASYRQVGLEDPEHTLRQKMMNHFAHTVIASDRGIRGSAKWAALVGNTHANTFSGVPGVAELEGAIGIRLEDVTPDSAQGVKPDIGQHYNSPNPTEPGGFVKSDLYYPMGTLQQARNLEQELPHTGMFTLDKSPSNRPILVHRSGDGALVYTPILKDGTHIYIERARWTTVHERRYDSTRELITALTLMGMKHVG